MDEIIGMINCADAEQIQQILHKVQQRYGECFPDWELHILSIHKKADRNQQIDRVMQLLEHWKSLDRL